MAVGTDLVGQFSGFIPKTTVLANFGLIILVVILVLGALAGGIYFLVWFLSFKVKVISFRNINGYVVPVGKTKGRLKRMGKAGDYIMILMKGRKILPAPEKYINKNTVWYFIREDGEWINFQLGDFDSQMKEAKVKYVHEDMRLARISIERNLRDRNLQKGFWQQYGQMIMSVLFLIIVTICLIILFREISSLTEAIGQMANTVTQNAENVNRLLTRTGSGAEPVPLILPLLPFFRKPLKRAERWFFWKKKN